MHEFDPFNKGLFPSEERVKGEESLFFFYLFTFFRLNKGLLFQGPTEFTETLNRMTIISLAITIKTRGIAEVEQMLYLQPLLEQIMATSQHTWSEKTLRYFPPLIRESLIGRMDKRGQAIQAWQQVCLLLITKFFSVYRLILLHHFSE